MTGNILGITAFTLPPYIQRGDTLVLSLNGRPVGAAKSQWYPYQVLRQTTIGDLTVESATRMVFEREGVLWQLTLKNGSSQPQTLNLAVTLRGYIASNNQKWDWSPPRPRNVAGFKGSVDAGHQVYVVTDSESPASTAFAFTPAPSSLTISTPSPPTAPSPTSPTPSAPTTPKAPARPPPPAPGEQALASWSLTLAPGETQTIGLVMAVGADATTTTNQAQTWAQSFTTQFDQAKQLWEKRWQAAFTPGNGDFSGSAPLLATSDSQLRRVYYMSIVSALENERTNLPMAPRCYVTCSPVWADTLEYFWDMELWSSLLTRLDPAMVKEHLKGFLSIDYNRCYARCLQSGKPSGPWYAANDLSLFTILWNYLTITGDWDFLKEKAGDHTILEHMDLIVTHWKSRVRPNATLADYGGATNLLECVPTYINQIPSLNAADVWMLRRAAEIHDHLGDAAQAQDYRTEATDLSAEVLKLYIPGQGVWNCRHNDGGTVQLRHCYDYITVGQCLTPDLTPEMKTEMTAFVERELLVPGWMRAQSLSDPAAKDSDRPDHGPLGAYDAWPALTAATMCAFGQYDKALSLVHRCEDVTHEGPFSQSHELVLKKPSGGPPPPGMPAAPVDPNNVDVRIAQRGGQDYNEECGASFASATITEGLFGCETGANDGLLAVRDPQTPRGFDGSLTGVFYRGARYTVTSSEKGLVVGQEPK